MKSRRLARELCLQMLYQSELSSGACEPGGDSAIDGSMNITGAAGEFCKELFRGITKNIDEIDGVILENSQNWTVDRMSVVDRNILRIAVYEICHMTDIPMKVSIDEAIELGKIFGSDDSPPFINGILDHVVKDRTCERRPA